MNTLETIIDEILKHDNEHPDHGEGCACHDKHAGAIRRLMREKGLFEEYNDKSRNNFRIVFGYIMRQL